MKIHEIDWVNNLAAGFVAGLALGIADIYALFILVPSGPLYMLAFIEIPLVFLGAAVRRTRFIYGLIVAGILFLGFIAYALVMGMLIQAALNKSSILAFF